MVVTGSILVSAQPAVVGTTQPRNEQGNERASSPHLNLGRPLGCCHPDSGATEIYGGIRARSGGPLCAAQAGAGRETPGMRPRATVACRQPPSAGETTPTSTRESTPSRQSGQTAQSTLIGSP